MSGLTGKATIQKMDDHWHKILLAVMLKHNISETVITRADLDKMEFGASVMLQELDDGLHVRALTPREAIAASSLPGAYTKFR